MQISKNVSLAILVVLLAVVLSGYISIGLSLILGIAYALIIGNPFRSKTQPYSAMILKYSIVLMGFGLNIKEIAQTAQDSFLLTLLTITFALAVGYLIGRLFKVESKLSFLISGGTAICGGSAIAALAPTIQAKQSQIALSMSIVFLLNGIGLLVYPEIGHYLQMTDSDFGLWSALGIHDTSSVVGAAASYSEEALKVATTAKLARALWIIPLVLMAGYLFKHKSESGKFPIFILFFIAASLISSFVPLIASYGIYAGMLAKKGMAVSLFLIGAGFTRETVKELEYTALWQGIVLWLLVSVFSYWVIQVI
ncbi:MAG: putative sulfate exporter family transporter [Gammaproteobacteria bacterium]|nr:putative sulfate exporter family transporter [Gammaproteobacteria bacterium]MDH5629498.1 putative sulfate exporter family transporter [Gammaproteobacteria bacterium]